MIQPTLNHLDPPNCVDLPLASVAQWPYGEAFCGSVLRVYLKQPEKIHIQYRKQFNRGLTPWEPLTEIVYWEALAK